MSNGNAQALVSQLMETNPEFARFVAENRGKTPEQAFAEHGFDYSQFRNALR